MVKRMRWKEKFTIICKSEQAMKEVKWELERLTKQYNQKLFEIRTVPERYHVRFWIESSLKIINALEIVENISSNTNNVKYYVHSDFTNKEEERMCVINSILSETEGDD